MVKSLESDVMAIVPSLAPDVVNVASATGLPLQSLLMKISPVQVVLEIPHSSVITDQGVCPVLFGLV